MRKDEVYQDEAWAHAISLGSSDATRKLQLPVVGAAIFGQYPRVRGDDEEESSDRAWTLTIEPPHDS